MTVVIFIALGVVGLMLTVWVVLELKKASNGSDDMFINAQGLRGISGSSSENLKNDEDRSSFISHTRTSVNKLNSSKSQIVVNRIEDKVVEKVDIDFNLFTKENLSRLSYYLQIEMSSINNILSEHRSFATEVLASSLSASKEVIIARAYIESLNERRQEIDSVIEEIIAEEKKSLFIDNKDKIAVAFRPLEFSADTISSLISFSSIPSTELVKVRSEVKLLLDRIQQSTASIRRRVA